MSYRTRTEIISSILEIANRGNGITKTKIMYGAFLSYSQMKAYLTILMDNGLISYDLDTRTFKTTDKGHRFLQVSNGLDTLVKEERASPSDTNPTQVDDFSTRVTRTTSNNIL